MNFPKKSRDWARKAAAKRRAEYRQIPPMGNRKEHLALLLYRERLFNYGYDEPLEQGIACRWPHEVKQKWECVENAVGRYMVAKELGLNPRFFFVYGYGLSDNRYEHAFIDVDVGLKKRVIIDSQLSTYGRYTASNGRILIADNVYTRSESRRFTQLYQLPEDAIIRTVKFLRTPKGIEKMFEEGQLVSSFRFRGITSNVFMQYEREVNEFYTAVTSYYDLFADRCISFQTEVGKDNPNQRVQFILFKDTKWAELLNASLIGEVNLELVRKYYDKHIKGADFVDYENTEYKSDANLDSISRFGQKPKQALRAIHQELCKSKELDEIIQENFEKLKQDKENFDRERAGLILLGFYLAKAGERKEGFVFSAKKRDEFARQFGEYHAAARFFEEARNAYDRFGDIIHEELPDSIKEMERFAKDIQSNVFPRLSNIASYSTLLSASMIDKMIFFLNEYKKVDKRNKVSQAWALRRAYKWLFREFFLNAMCYLTEFDKLNQMPLVVKLKQHLKA